MEKKDNYSTSKKWKNRPEKSEVKQALKVISGLESLDETIEFLEILKEKKAGYGSPLWVAADEFYYNYLRIEREKGNETGITAARYAQLFSSSRAVKIEVKGEDLPDEYIVRVSRGVAAR